MLEAAFCARRCSESSPGGHDTEPTPLYRHNATAPNTGCPSMRHTRRGPPCAPRHPYMDTEVGRRQHAWPYDRLPGAPSPVHVWCRERAGWRLRRSTKVSSLCDPIGCSVQPNVPRCFCYSSGLVEANPPSIIWRLRRRGSVSPGAFRFRRDKQGSGCCLHPLQTHRQTVSLCRESSGDHL